MTIEGSSIQKTQHPLYNFSFIPSKHGQTMTQFGVSSGDVCVCFYVCESDRGKRHEEELGDVSRLAECLKDLVEYLCVSL